MDFLGMGPMEILLVLIIGFLFLGPERLPTMAAKAGEWYRKLTKAASGLAKSITEEVSAEGKATSDVTKSLTSVAKEISDETKAATEATKSIVREISAEAKYTPDSTKPTTEKTPTETKPAEAEKTSPASTAGNTSDK